MLVSLNVRILESSPTLSQCQHLEMINACPLQDISYKDSAQNMKQRFAIFTFTRFYGTCGKHVLNTARAVLKEEESYTPVLQLSSVHLHNSS